MDYNAQKKSNIMCDNFYVDLTFNQLLAKYGYIQDESQSNKNRKREWAVKKTKYDPNASSDESEF